MVICIHYLFLCIINTEHRFRDSLETNDSLIKPFTESDLLALIHTKIGESKYSI